MHWVTYIYSIQTSWKNIWYVNLSSGSTVEHICFAGCRLFYNLVCNQKVVIIKFIVVLLQIYRFQNNNE